MSFWWVNHGQTARAEISEGYIWSPKKDQNGSRNEAYLNLTRVNPGDTIFSYADLQIPAVGKILSLAEEEQRPSAFGKVGNQWDDAGWIVRVKWLRLHFPIRPKDYLDQIAPLLPSKYSPLQANGNGNQKLYLTKIGDDLGDLLLTTILAGEPDLDQRLEEIDIELQEASKVDEINNSNLSKTQRNQLIQARVGQGIFRENVERIESHCRITKLTDKGFLIASHIKPWKDSDNRERLDGHNGFLLSPHVDNLFDKGWISFSKNGRILVSNKRVESILQIWSIDPLITLGNFTKQQEEYLEYHREVIYKQPIEQLKI